MTVYMLKSELGWYGPRGRWKKTKEGARVWTNKAGPSAAKGSVTGGRHYGTVYESLEVVEFELTAKPDVT